MSHFCKTVIIIITILFVFNCLLSSIIEATRVWTVLVSICRANHDKEEQKECAFNLRTEEASAAHYFQVRYMMIYRSHDLLFAPTQWYGHLCQQQNMLQVKKPPNECDISMMVVLCLLGLYTNCYLPVCLPAEL